VYLVLLKFDQAHLQAHMLKLEKLPTLKFNFPNVKVQFTDHVSLIAKDYSGETSLLVFEHVIRGKKVLEKFHTYIKCVF